MSEETDRVVVDLKIPKRPIIRAQLIAAFEFIALENGLSFIEMYFMAMFVMGGMAAINGVAPRDKNSFDLFRSGYDSFRDFIQHQEDK